MQDSFEDALLWKNGCLLVILIVDTVENDSLYKKINASKHSCQVPIGLNKRNVFLGEQPRNKEI